MTCHVLVSAWRKGKIHFRYSLVCALSAKTVHQNRGCDAWNTAAHMAHRLSGPPTTMCHCVLLLNRSMTTSSLLEGGCLCGHIRYRASGPALQPHTCSCRNCQRHSGALTQMWIEFEQHQLQWTGAGGAPALWRSSEVSSRAFCPVCGSTLGAVDDAATLAIAVGTLDQLPDHGIAPEFHSFSDELPLWWPLPEVVLPQEKVSPTPSGLDL